MNIEGVEIGQGQPCRFVAEISNNHNGDIGLATSLMDAAKSAGADFVKFQAYTADELVALRGDGPAPAPWGDMGWTMRTLYTKASTPLAWFPKLFAHARKIGLVPFSSVFGAESLAMLQSVDCPAYKIAKLDRMQADLLKSVLDMDTCVIISTDTPDGYASDQAADIVLYCPGGYPCAVEDVHLPDHFGEDQNYLGLSSHCLDPALPIAAVARGAQLLEYHFHKINSPSELEANISLNEYQFNQMVRDVRRTELLLHGK